MLRAFPFQERVPCLIGYPNPSTCCAIPERVVKHHNRTSKTDVLKIVVFQKALTFTATNRKPALDERFVIRKSIHHGNFLFSFALGTLHS
jgi:hypothetical protein